MEEKIYVTKKIITFLSEIANNTGLFISELGGVYEHLQDNFPRFLIPWKGDFLAPFIFDVPQSTAGDVILNVQTLQATRDS